MLAALAFVCSLISAIALLFSAVMMTLGLRNLHKELANQQRRSGWSYDHDAAELWHALQLARVRRRHQERKRYWERYEGWVQ